MKMEHREGKEIGPCAICCLVIHGVCLLTDALREFSNEPKAVRMSLSL